MIKFFRQIRQQLLSENRIGIYLLYAIGEIALVVIGILLAVQINTWNTNRINQLEEKTYLRRLIFDLERDLLNIQETIENYEQRLILGVDIANSLGKNNTAAIEKSNTYLNAVNNYPKHKDWVPNSFGGRLYNVLIISLFKTSDVTFQELLSTGKIDLISNQELKIAIQEYYLKAREVQNFQDRIVMPVQHNYRIALLENNISNLNRSSYLEIRKELKNTKGLITSIENYIDLTDALLRNWGVSDLKNNAEDLIEVIGNALKEETSAGSDG